MVENLELKQAEAEIQRLKEELERRVVERTRELAAAYEQLRREIGERQQADALLHAREQEFRAFVENTPDQIIRYDREFRRAYVNPAVTAAYGLPKEAFIGKPIGSIVEDGGLKADTEEITAVRRHVESVFDTGKPTEYEVSWSLPGGRRTFWVRMFPEFDSDGRVLNVLGVARDVTERKQAEEALKESQRRLEEAQRVAHVGHYEHDLDTGVIIMSDENYRILGLQPQGNIPLSRGFELIHPDDRERLHQARNEAVRTGQSFDVEYRVVRPDGEVRYVHGHTDVFRDEQGRARRTFGVSQDITERKQVEEALDERLRFETLLTELSAAFANLSPNEVDREIERWLQALVEFLGVERASFFQFREDWVTLYWSHSYTVPRIEPLRAPPIGMKVQFPWITDQLRRGGTIKWARVPDDMPEEAVKEKEDAARLGIKSLLNIPMLMGGSVVCTIAFISIVNYRDWPDSMVARLRLVGEIFAAAVERKRAEAALSQAEEKYHGIFEHAIEGIFQTTPDGRYLTANPALARMLGYASPQELMGSRTDIGRQQYVEPERRWEFKRLLEEHNVVQGFEYQAYRKDGSKIWLSENGRAVRDEGGAVLYYEGFTEDITERKQAEEALKESQRRLEEAQRIAHVGHWERDLKTDAITWSDEVYRILGLERQASPPSVWEHMLHPEDRERILLAIEEAQHGNRRYDVEYRVVRPDGEVRFLHSQGDIIRDEQGELCRAFGIAQDITERKLAEEALKKEKEILKKIFDNVPVLIGFVGEDGRVKLVNPEWERTMGWTLKELQEQDVDIFTEAYPDLSYRREVLDFVAASTGEWVDLKIMVRDGRVIDSACAVVHLSDGTRVAIAQDITERKIAEKMLQKFSQRLVETQEAERRRVARELHDEIGQALTAIKINLQALQHPAGTSPLTQQLNESVGLVDRALQQVRDLSFNLRPSLLDDLGLIAALRWYLDREARRADLTPTFVVDLKETRLPPEFETACFRITQEALTNVVRHAQARQIWVELRQRGAELHLTIRDDGIGFEVGAVWRRRASNGGLGLQGMQERALILGGKIEIESAPVRGTEVHVWFPLPGAVSPAAKKEVE